MGYFAAIVLCLNLSWGQDHPDKFLFEQITTPLRALQLSIGGLPSHVVRKYSPVHVLSRMPAQIRGKYWNNLREHFGADRVVSYEEFELRLQGLGMQTAEIRSSWFSRMHTRMGVIAPHDKSFPFVLDPENGPATMYVVTEMSPLHEVFLRSEGLRAQEATLLERQRFFVVERMDDKPTYVLSFAIEPLLNGTGQNEVVMRFNHAESFLREVDHPVTFMDLVLKWTAEQFPATKDRLFIKAEDLLSFHHPAGLLAFSNAENAQGYRAIRTLWQADLVRLELAQGEGRMWGPLAQALVQGNIDWGTQQQVFDLAQKHWHHSNTTAVMNFLKTCLGVSEAGIRTGAFERILSEPQWAEQNALLIELIALYEFSGDEIRHFYFNEGSWRISIIPDRLVEIAREKTRSFRPLDRQRNLIEIAKPNGSAPSSAIRIRAIEALLDPKMAAFPIGDLYQTYFADLIEDQREDEKTRVAAARLLSLPSQVVPKAIRHRLSIGMGSGIVMKALGKHAKRLIDFNVCVDALMKHPEGLLHSSSPADIRELPNG